MLVAGALLHALASGGIAAPPPERQQEKVVGEVARFFRDGQTLVNGFVRVPHRLLSGLTGAGSLAVYSLEVRVVDQSGTVLTRDRWTRRIPWETRQLPHSQSLEPFAFALAPGKYDVLVTVEDSGSGVREAIELPVEAFAARPRASDLLLASAIRRVRGTDSVPAASEVRKGNLLIATAPDLTLALDRPSLAYYCEVYRDSAGSVASTLRVIGEDGRTIVQAQPTETQVGPGGGPIAATVDLAGLPPGSYRLVLAIGAGSDTAQRTAGFRVAGFETAAELVKAESSSVQDRFTEATEAQLDSMAAPLVYLDKTGGDQAVYRGLSYEAKRRFLRDFWRHRESDARLREAEENGFYGRIAQANRRFKEAGSASIPGWRTDRGRIFIKYGDPDEVRREPQTGPDRPWEAWKYTKGRALKFVFLDFTRLGNYSLIFSDDRTERNPSDWMQLLSSDAVAEITNF